MGWPELIALTLPPAYLIVGWSSDVGVVIDNDQTHTPRLCVACACTSSSYPAHVTIPSPGPFIGRIDRHDRTVVSAIEGSAISSSNPRAAFDVDSRAIRHLEPFPELADIPGAYWPCTRCSRSFPVSASYAVEFESARRRLQFVACPDCAARYQIPRPVNVDLERCPPPDRVPHEVKTLTAHAWHVSNVRTRPPDRAMRLRDADVRKLAADSDQTPAELLDQLHNRGMLASD